MAKATRKSMAAWLPALEEAIDAKKEAVEHVRDEDTQEKINDEIDQLEEILGAIETYIEG
jgi:hypothetical protein